MQARLPAVAAPHVFSVTELATQIRSALETRFAIVWVSGEVSNLRRPSSGHVYFTLKDEQSQLAAVMFRRTAELLPFELDDGAEIVARGRVSVYPARGALQLYVDAVEPRGLGALQLAFEQLKARLGAEGLFAPERKRALPFWPRRVGVVTALGGAAVHDILVTLRRRAPGVDVRIRPVRVQGVGAGAEIAAAIEDLNACAGVDVIIVGRGGGSLEDLWPFNEEGVARAIAGSAVPVVSAVGHETDFTIADFVADVRAPTPTAAAQMVAPDRAALAAQVAGALAGLRGAAARRVGGERLRLEALERRLAAAVGARLHGTRAAVREIARALEQLAPRRRLDVARARLVAARHRLALALRASLERRRGQVARATAQLDSLSPLAVLDRGYALVWRVRDGVLVRDAAELARGERLRLRFARGEARARIEDDGT
jgi:exodeoxyribonuclease VII large subunit